MTNTKYNTPVFKYYFNKWVFKYLTTLHNATSVWEDRRP